MHFLKELRAYAKDLVVLVVEDNPELNQQLVDMCELFFKDVHFAYDAEEGFNLYNRVKIDILITDITMPKMDGIHMARLMKRMNNDLPIMIVSAHDSFEYISDIVDLGVKQFVKKPFDENDFLYRLLKMCEEFILIQAFEKTESTEHPTPLFQHIEQIPPKSPLQVSLLTIGKKLLRTH